MRKNTKKIISSVLALSLCFGTGFTGVASQSSNSISVSAASAGSISMTESDIQVKISKNNNNSIDFHEVSYGYEMPNSYSATDYSRNYIKFNNTTVLGMYNLKMVIKVASGTTTINDLKDEIEISSTHEHSKINADITKLSSKNGYDFFEIVSDKFISFDQRNVLIYSTLKDLKFQVESAKLIPNTNDEYYTIETTSNGDDLYACVPYDKNVSTETYKKWAKRVCLYMNSLKDVTNVSYDKLFLSFRYAHMPKDAGAYCSSVSDLNETPFVTYGVFANEVFNNVLKSDINSIEWVELHEISHAYRIGDDFSENYIYNDEVYTNLRGLTAIQNCDAIRNLKIIYEDATYKNYTRAYGDERSSDDYHFNMGKKYVNCIHNLSSDWTIFEDFFKGKDYSNNFTNKEFKNALSTFSKKTGYYSYTLPAKRFVNSLFALYKICGERYIVPTFENFVETYFGWSLIKDFAKSEIYNSNGDINFDEKKTLNDATILSTYLNCNVELNESQLERADVDSNGVVDNYDLEYLLKIISHDNK
ncbi:MAG: dockerin type I repeat-containing protein [Oscillospiraceae bacterium]|nr:dockerin type I repeat-containing protein [Oscillospiraceae bacterium]